MKIHGWGRYSMFDAEVLKPKNLYDVQKIIRQNKKVIARGLGRSYGDSANNNVVVQTNYLHNFISFDLKNGIITCEGGVSIQEINRQTIPKGWFIPVTPGSSYVTIGGAIASDVHGKNHHRDGTLSQYILSIQLMLGDGNIFTISKNINSDLFKATCGGMGLTGIIISATIKLKSINSSQIKNTIIKANCLEEICDQFERNSSSPYSVAWVDCSAKGKNLGRSLLFLGEHMKNGELKKNSDEQKYIPIKICSLFLNRYIIKIFNFFYYYRNLKKRHFKLLTLKEYFYPLDNFLNWNQLYGKSGLIQYQFVVPKKNGIQILKEVIKTISEYNQTPFLGVLKIFGSENENYLSFPLEGYTLALDFKFNRDLLKLINVLDKKIINNGGRIYLAKDALMSKETFRACYPKWNLFEEVRSKYKAIGKFSSLQSIRLGLE
jgi:decaprenylphospho-beta-D-ribofuranose 2-oxidase